MRILIFKLNATGDVVRTTALLRRFAHGVVWVTSKDNRVLIDGLPGVERCLAWEQAQQGALSQDHFDLVINLEDETKIAALAGRISHARLFGAYTDRAGRVAYSDDARSWFDLSLVSRYGKAQADRLKWLNRRSYQDLIFEGLGLPFDGEPYCLPEPTRTGLTGDVAIAPNAGPVWPMKGWAHYEALRRALQARGLIVNVLPQRATLLEHLGDVAGHRCLVSGDSLPMHLALGAGVRCVTIFNCTSPWEIHTYGLQTQLVSPLLENFFYKRHFDERATTAVALEDVLEAVHTAVSDECPSRLR
jgi:heptosyltransferase II